MVRIKSQYSLECWQSFDNHKIHSNLKAVKHKKEHVTSLKVKNSFRFKTMHQLHFQLNILDIMIRIWNNRNFSISLQFFAVEWNLVCRGLPRWYLTRRRKISWLKLNVKGKIILLWWLGLQQCSYLEEPNRSSLLKQI